MHPKVEKLTQLKFFEQRSEQWLAKRRTMLTASTFGYVLGNDPHTSRNTIFRRLTGQVKEYRPSSYMMHGIRYESDARKKYEEISGEEVIELGCIAHSEVHENGYTQLGGSPDGITAKTGKLIEIKCPVTRKIENFVPLHYVDQVQGLMWILDLSECDFVQYRPKTEFNEEEFQITSISKDPEWEKKSVPELLKFWKEVQDMDAEANKCSRAACDAVTSIIRHHFDPTDKNKKSVEKRQSELGDMLALFKVRWIPKRKRYTRKKPLYLTKKCLIED